MVNIEAELLNKALDQVYLIHGDDNYRQQEIFQVLYKRVVSDGFPDWNWVNVAATKNQELNQIIDQLQTTPWGNGVKIVAVTDADNIPADLLTKLVNWLDKHPDRNCLALFFKKLDRRLKAVKQLVAIGTEIKCDPIKGEELVRWIKDYLSLQDKKMSQEVLDEFLARVGNNLHLITNELEKLLLYVEDNSSINLTDVELVTSVTPGQLEHGVIFKLVDAIAAREGETALAILRELLDGGEPPLRILPLIDRQLRLILAAKTRGQLQIAQTAKMMGENQDYALKKIQRYQNNYTLEQLYTGFEQIIVADSELKYGADPEQTIAQLILQLCG